MKRLAVGTILVCLCLTFAPTIATATTSPLSSKRVMIVVVAGQSNAEGYESYVAGTNIGSQAADKTVQMAFLGDYATSHATTPVSLDTPQVLAVNGRQIFGPEVGIARYLWEHGDRRIAIGKVVKGGSSLASWRPGGTLLDELTHLVAHLKAWEKGRGVTATVGGIVWMQGETDALSAAAASKYKGALATFLPQLRSAVHASARTPIVIAETTTAPWVQFQASVAHGACKPATCAELFAWNKLVRAAQRAATKTVPRTFIVDSSTFPRASIQLHLSATGELLLGSALGKSLARHL